MTKDVFRVHVGHAVLYKSRVIRKKTLFLLKKYSYQLIKNTWAVQCKVFFYLECAEQSGREDGCSDPTTDNGNSKLFLKQIKNQNYDFL